MSFSKEMQRYQETDIQSISAEKLIVLMYEKMADDLLEARRAITAGDRVRMADRVTHSQKIIAELRSALDHTAGSDVSRNLEALYDFLFLEHLEILLDQDVRRVDNCLAVISPLLDAWRQIPAGTAGETAHKRSLQSVSA